MDSSRVTWDYPQLFHRYIKLIMQNLENVAIRQLFRWLNRKVYGNLDSDSDYADRVDEAPPDAETLARNKEMLGHFRGGIDTPPIARASSLQHVPPTDTAVTATIPSEPIIGAPVIASNSEQPIITQAHENNHDASATSTLEQRLATLIENTVCISIISCCLHWTYLLNNICPPFLARGWF